MIEPDKYEGLIDAEGHIDYDGLDYILAEVKRLREALQDILSDFETQKTDLWTIRNRIEIILKGDVE